MNCELPDVQAGFRKGRGTRDQIANIRQIIQKARESSRKNIYFVHLTCLVRNLYAGQEVTEPQTEETGSKLGKE